MKSFIAPAIILGCLLFSCAEEKSEWTTNPNGDSELALLMRDMYDESMLAKTALANGEKLDLVMEHEGIFTVAATEPDKQSGDLFKAFGTRYLELVEELKDPNNPNPEQSYTKLINSCKNCHSALCPGPLVKIEHLVIP